MDEGNLFPIIVGLTFAVLVIAGIRWYRQQYNAERFLRRGVAHLAAGRLDPAIREFDRAIAHEPYYAEAFFQRGLAYKTWYAIEKAISDFSETIRLDPNHIEAYRQRVALHLHLQKVEEAISDWTQLLTIQPDLVEAYNERANLYAQQGHLEKALADCTQMTTLNPQNSDAYCKRAILHLRQNDRKKALSDFDQAITWNPQNHNAYNQRGLLRESLDEIGGAISDYEQALTLHPDFADAHFNRGLAYAYQKNSHEAQREINEALAIKSRLNKDVDDATVAVTIAYEEWSQGTAGISLAAAYMTRGGVRISEQTLFGIAIDDFVGAIADLDHAIGLDAKLTMAYMIRGLAYLGKGNSLLALRDLFHFARLGGISEFYRMAKRDSKGEDIPSETEFNKEFWRQVNEGLRKTTPKEKK